jgi:SSS family solute:Na+ symporter
MPDFPFMNRMGLVFLISLGLAVAISLVQQARPSASRITMEGVTFRTPPAFNVAGIGVILILIALYATWW